MQPDVNTLTRNAADKAYELAGVGPEDLDLVELHDCFATAELCHYDNLRLCEPGGAGAFIDSGGPRRDGKTPVNVSGGLISKGHPLGATGVANVFEVTTHLRGEAGDRQIEGAKVGMTHVIGLGSACSRAHPGEGRGLRRVPLVVVVAAVLLGGCTKAREVDRTPAPLPSESPPPTPSGSPTASPVDAELDDGRHFGFIKSVDTSANSVEFDLAEFYTGEDANEPHARTTAWAKARTSTTITTSGT